MHDAAAQSRRLIEDARTGDRGAIDRLWAGHQRWAMAVILAHRPRAAEIEDLLQEVAVRFVSRIDTLRDPESLRPWLRQIILNVCRGFARGHRTVSTIDESGNGEGRGALNVPLSAEPSAEQSVGGSDAARTLLEQALSLPPEYREPLLLRSLRSLSYQQIGELLDLPVTTVETRLARARRMLRSELGEALGLIDRSVGSAVPNDGVADHAARGRASRAPGTPESPGAPDNGAPGGTAARRALPAVPGGTDDEGQAPVARGDRR